MAHSLSSSWLDLLLREPLEVQAALVRDLTPSQLQELELATRWRPDPENRQQQLAYQTDADILFYGGAAGGGKTDLLLGVACTQHSRSIIFRREYPRLAAVITRSREIFSGAATYNQAEHVWSFRDGRAIRFGSLQYEHDAQSWQGQPHDLYGFDELPEFAESQFRFVIGWNRSTVPGQRCRVVCTGNPPTDSDGEWVTRFFAPWLDEAHPNPAKPGELRWFTTHKGKDLELPDGSPVLLDGELVRPRSRTFIPARVQDNSYLRDTDYIATLQAMPEPLRSQMLFGDFRAGREDAAYQVIPSEWVDLAMRRWKPDGKRGAQSALGVDVARGGKDKTTIAPRYGNWFDLLRKYPGKSTPDGPAVAGLVIAERRDNAVVNIDVCAVGTSPYDSLRNGWVDEDGDKHDGIKDRAVPMNAGEGSDATDKLGVLRFVNQRAEWWWGMREDLDPASGQDLALPLDPELKADLCAPRWKPTARGVQIESKEDIAKRIGRSTDTGDAVVMARAQKRLPGAGWVDFARAEVAAQAAKAAKERG